MPLSYQEIKRAARATVKAFAKNSLECCVFGSLGCALYGAERVPNDVDMIVLTDQHTTEELKHMLCETDSKFFLVDSRNPNATYQVLWYSLGSKTGLDCKIDILIPCGDLKIPRIPLHRVRRPSPTNDIPVVPPLPLLLLKLQGWSDHCAAKRMDLREKRITDIDDIDELLEIMVQDHDETVKTERWMPRWFVSEAQERVDRYVKKFPESKESWAEIGFEV